MRYNHQDHRYEWILKEADVDSISIGAGILACGGGGSPYLGRMACREMMKSGCEIRIIAPADLTDTETGSYGAFYGVPMVFSEKLISGNELLYAYNKLVQHVNPAPTVITPFEIGGINSIIPFILGAQLGVPVVDCDYMGRAFPELSMITPVFTKLPLTPVAYCSVKQEDMRIMENE